MEFRLTATLDTSPHPTPVVDSATSPPTPTTKPKITTTRHITVRVLTLDLSMTMLNIALNTIVSDLEPKRGWRWLVMDVCSSVRADLACTCDHVDKNEINFQK